MNEVIDSLEDEDEIYKHSNDESELSENESIPSREGSITSHIVSCNYLFYKFSL